MKLKTEQIVLGIVVVVLLYLFFLAPKGNGQSQTGLFSGNTTQCTWNGQCTQPIVNSCCPNCPSVRTCGGSEENPYDCLSKYCFANDNWCMPYWNETTELYDCTCESTDEPPFPD